MAYRLGIRCKPRHDRYVNENADAFPFPYPVLQGDTPWRTRPAAPAVWATRNARRLLEIAIAPVLATPPSCKTAFRIAWTAWGRAAPTPAHRLKGRRSWGPSRRVAPIAPARGGVDLASRRTDKTALIKVRQLRAVHPDN